MTPIVRQYCTLHLVLRVENMLQDGRMTGHYPETLVCSRHVQVEDIGQGHFGIAKKMIFRPTGEQVAVKFIERGEQVCSSNLDFDPSPDPMA